MIEPALEEALRRPECPGSLKALSVLTRPLFIDFVILPLLIIYLLKKWGGEQMDDRRAEGVLNGLVHDDPHRAVVYMSLMSTGPTR